MSHKPNPSGRGRGGGPGRPEGGPPKRDILQLEKWIDNKIRVKFAGGRELTGTLKGFDPLLNLVLDDVEEVLRDPQTLQPYQPQKTRVLGLAVVRGTSIMAVNPLQGFEEISNPFLQNEE